MPRHAAFLRGVNLASRRRIGSDALRSLFGRMGFRDVATFRASGNVVFDAGRESQAKLTNRIETGLAESLGFEVTVFLRTAGELRAIARHVPFDRRLVEASQGKLQVVLLSRRAGSAARREVLALATDEDLLAFGDRELYWLPSGGMRDSALSFKSIENVLGPTTTRTKGTIDALTARYLAS
jgi:uncharacterized protein (DUF1697 family)